ncbi:MAG: DNA polymerase III subunit beta [Proteobacteria bacterium]|nr:DNA polymerase III subunit beta [Pseudomonadota bacterium]
MSMKVVVERGELIKALNRVQSVVEKRNAVPILANIKLETGVNALKITATDMDVCVIDFAPAQIDIPGSTTVPVSLLYEIARRLPDSAMIEMAMNEDSGRSQLHITVGSSNFTLPCLPVTDFPNFETTPCEHKFAINSALLKALINRTKHAIALEEGRYYLGGAYMHVVQSDGGNMLRFVATDGHRLAMAEGAAPEGSDQCPGVIIPRKAMNELSRLLESSVGQVEVLVSRNRITFIIGNTTFISRLVDAKFPDYNRVIPSNNNLMLEVPAKDLARAIDLVVSVSSDKTKAVRLQLDQAEIVLSASSDINGNATGIQRVSAIYDAHPMSISFNSRYVLDSLAALEGETVRIMLPEGVGAIMAQDPEDRSSIQILMPMQE